ncbi:MAG: YbjN domain-containing protein [Rikenellaceae bacterium]|jgi:hypothetical protein|nr:YbjN domain-containing protein [Rikenellaceae bacterium]
MKKAFTFHSPVIRHAARIADEAIWEKSLELFDNKQYLASFYTLLDYLNPDVRAKHGNASGSEFSVPHGSIVVNIRIEGEQLTVTAPFLAMPEKGKVPFMRQLASLNDDLIMPQIVLEDDRLNFVFGCPLAMAHPHKLYNAIRQICLFGDKWDDEFVTKFGATRLYEPKITPYDSATVEKAIEIIRQSAAECLEAVSWFEGKRDFQNVWGAISITLFKIFHAVVPQGQLLNDLVKALDYHFRDDISPADMMKAGRAAIEKLGAMSVEQLAPELYSVETLISDKDNATLANIQEALEERAKKARKSFESKDHLNCAMSILYTLYKIWYDKLVPDDVNAVMTDALKRSSAVDFETAAEILLTAIENIVEGDLTVEGGAGTGFGFDMAAYMKNVQDMMASFFGGGTKK